MLIKLSHLYSAPVAVLTADMKNELWPREEEARVTGSVMLRTLGRGDDRQLCRCKKKENLMGDRRRQTEEHFWSLEPLAQCGQDWTGVVVARGQVSEGFSL